MSSTLITTWKTFIKITGVHNIGITFGNGNVEQGQGKGM